jgi:hypothetical protein
MSIRARVLVVVAVTALLTAGNQRAGYGVPFEPQHVARLMRSLSEPARP